MSNIALLVLENPWETPKGNPKRHSVLPFLQGLEKLHPKLTLYYSTFYEKHGFRAALENDLTETKEDRQILYIGSHGLGKRIANMTLKSAIEAIRDHHHQIEGVLLSSCEVGRDEEAIRELLIGTNIRWVIGYNCSINWFESSLIDLALLHALVALRKSALDNETKLKDAIKEALSIFNQSFILGEDLKIKQSLEESLVAIIQTSGQGKRPKNITKDLFSWPSQIADN